MFLNKTFIKDFLNAQTEFIKSSFLSEKFDILD